MVGGQEDGIHPLGAGCREWLETARTDLFGPVERIVKPDLHAAGGQRVAQWIRHAERVLLHVRSEAQAEDRGRLQRPAFGHPCDHLLRHRVVHGAPRFGELEAQAALAEVRDEEVGVHRRAVPPHADPRSQQGRLAVGIGPADHLAEIDVPRRREARELVHQRDVHVAVDHAGELHQLRGLDAGHGLHELVAQELAVERKAGLERLVIEPAHDLRIGLELGQHRAALDALRAVDEQEVDPVPAAAPLEAGEDRSARGAHRHRGLDREQCALREEGRQVFEAAEEGLEEHLLPGVDDERNRHQHRARAS